MTGHESKSIAFKNPSATFLVLSFNVEFDDHTDEVYFTYGVSDSSVKLRSVLNPNGLFVLLLWQDDSKTWSELGDWTGECVRENALTCGRNREGFSKLELLKMPDHAVVLENKKSKSENQIISFSRHGSNDFQGMSINFVSFFIIKNKPNHFFWLESYHNY